MPIISQDRRRISEGSTALPWAGSFEATLDTGETITSVTIAAYKGSATTTEISVSSAAASSTSLVIKGETITAARACTCTIAATSAVAGTIYTLRVTFGTSASRSEIMLFELEAV